MDRIFNILGSKTLGYQLKVFMKDLGRICGLWVLAHNCRVICYKSSRQKYKKKQLTQFLAYKTFILYKIISAGSNIYFFPRKFHFMSKNPLCYLEFWWKLII